ncbi:hypothetical protein AAG570_002216 [Ranatra chinensis]|uniref:THO complex subunit 1 n=1 Tax=Ranatra chinensis TaxID=642074 RepID=A0ABD0YTK8_9HEMI
MGDIFDATTLDICQALFEFMEKNFTTWKDPLFFASCKNNILRMCNDLLRRLSKSQNTLFCGRILLFLAMYFPFSERSGLNIVSEFNLDNVTKLETEPSPDDVYKNMMEEVFPVKIDYNFYCKFWSLQDYFRNPNQCYNRAQWREFVNSSNAVLSVFRNCKVEADPIEMVSTSRTEGRHYFVKFLTSQKLLALQLNDVHFRRTIYLQFLILFQYLNAHVKSRPESYELSADQVDWVRETTELVHKLIKETPPHGKKFMKTILQILQREEHWITWKNEGCPALKPVATKDNPPKRTKLADSTTSAEASSSDFSKLSKLNRRPLKDVLIERKDKRQPFFKCL